MFGQVKDILFVVDFDGNGYVDISICFNDYFFIYGNGIQELDELYLDILDFDERVVYGDWNGDGQDEVGVY